MNKLTWVVSKAFLRHYALFGFSKFYYFLCITQNALFFLHNAKCITQSA